jgi:hypothetical protein
VGVGFCVSSSLTIIWVMLLDINITSCMSILTDQMQLSFCLFLEVFRGLMKLMYSDAHFVLTFVAVEFVHSTVQPNTLKRL